VTHSPLEITADLVHELVRDQHPDLADRPVRLGARGWSCQLWRLGDDLAVRLPWAVGDADELLINEHTWVPELAPRLPLPVPVPQRLGRPSALLPRSWIITTWVPGTPADLSPVVHGADALAAFLTALHQPAPVTAPTGRDRGGPLTDRDAGFTAGVTRTAERGLIDDPDAVRAVWKDALTAPPYAGPPLWIHADLHAANVLTTDGNLTGVIDFGDLCAGDPAYDLSAAWHLLPDPDSFFRSYRPAVDDATLRRARGWAMARVISGLLIGHDPGPGGKPTWAPPARAALHRLFAD
jgi:aminoglycoside phosphotransferase (APT) family kinase protein